MAEKKKTTCEGDNCEVEQLENKPQVALGCCLKWDTEQDENGDYVDAGEGTMVNALDDATNNGIDVLWNYKCPESGKATRTVITFKNGCQFRDAYGTKAQKNLMLTGSAKDAAPNNV